jgi:hypothetical protein
MTHVERCTACERRHRMLVETSAVLRALGRVAEHGSPVRIVRRSRRYLWVAAAAAVVAIGAGALYLHETRSRPLADDQCAHCGPEPFAPPPRINDVAERR